MNYMSKDDFVVAFNFKEYTTKILQSNENMRNKQSAMSKKMKIDYCEAKNTHLNQYMKSFDIN